MEISPAETTRIGGQYTEREKRKVEKRAVNKLLSLILYVYSYRASMDLSVQSVNADNEKRNIGSQH